MYHQFLPEASSQDAVLWIRRAEDGPSRRIRGSHLLAEGVERHRVLGRLDNAAKQFQQLPPPRVSQHLNTLYCTRTPKSSSAFTKRSLRRSPVPVRVLQPTVERGGLNRAQLAHSRRATAPTPRHPQHLLRNAPGRNTKFQILPSTSSSGGSHVAEVFRRRHWATVLSGAASSAAPGLPGGSPHLPSPPRWQAPAPPLPARMGAVPAE